MCGVFFKRKFSSVTACFFLFLVYFISCGLETLYYLKYPTRSHDVSYTNEDRLYDYFEVVSGDNSDLDGSDFKFSGTEIYYKIFNNTSTLTSSVSTITSAVNSSDISAAASTIINTKKYKPLTISSSNDTPFIKGHNKKVYIRLNKIASDALNHPNEVQIDGKLFAYPKRFKTSGSKKIGFEFNKDDDDNPVPEEGDDDVEWSSSFTEDKVWYVDMWAFSSGKDTSYTWSYSEAVHLGNITIREDEYNK